MHYNKKYILKEFKIEDKVLLFIKINLNKIY